jgi:hypothetical protein
LAGGDRGSIATLGAVVIGWSILDDEADEEARLTLKYAK